MRRLASCWGATERRTLTGHHTDSVTAVAFNSDGSVLASASYDASVCLWSCSNGELLSVFRGHRAPVTALVMVASDGSLLASGSNDGTLLLWAPPPRGAGGGPSSSTGGVVRHEITRAHTDKVASLCADPRGSWIASGGRDDHVRLFSVATGAMVGASKAHVDNVAGLAVSPDGTWMASGSHDQSARLWKVLR